MIRLVDILPLTLGLLVAPHLMADAPPPNYQALMVGSWQCETQVASPYGDYVVVSQTQLDEQGQLTSQGDILLQHPSLPNGVPMRFQARGQWSYFNTWVTAKNIDGTITTPYPLLDVFADNLRAQILAQAQVKVQLTRIGKNSMALVAEDASNIRCVR